MNTLKLAALAYFFMMAAPAFAVITNPSLMSWGIDGAGSGAKYLPGGSVTVSLQIGGLRTNPTQTQSIDVSVYLSRVEDSISSPAVYLGYITATLPGSQTSGPVAGKTFTLPTSYGSVPTPAGGYYIVFSVVGTQGSDVESSSFSIYNPNIQVQRYGSDLTDGSSTVAFGQTSASGTISNDFFIYSTGGGDLRNVAVSISGTNASNFSLTQAPASTIASNGSSMFTIRFAPGSVGTKTANVSIASNVAGSKNPFTFALSGLAVAAPTVVTSAASSITSTSAVLNGSVNAQGSTGADTSFDYGTSTSYGSVIAGNPTTASGSSATAISRSISNLFPGTTYHFRVKATSIGGTTLGTDLSFTTLTNQQSWLQTHFGTTSPVGNAAPDADPNHNGVPNLAEYTFGGSPASTNGSTAFLPQPSVSSSSSCLQLSFTRYLDRNDVTIIVQAAESPLGTWINLATSSNGAAFTVSTPGASVTESGSGNTRTVTVGDLYPTTDPDHPKRFLRTLISQ